MTGSEAFASAFARTFQQCLCPAVVGNKDGDEDRTEDRDARARRLALRVLFLLFVQGKGWLDGNTTYVQDRYDAVASDPDRDVARDLFAPLFSALATPGRTSGPLGTLPYFGGPFLSRATHADDTSEATPALVDAEFYHALLDSSPDANGQPRAVCRRYEFALTDESDGATGEGEATVTPATVARGFELAMGTDERAEKGAYYTPERITEYMARTALSRYLAGATDATDAQATALVSDGRPPGDPETTRAVYDELRAITVLDPAAGGGAFVVAVLDALTDAARSLVVADAGTNADAFALRRDFLVDSLYGVDLDPAGVEVCRFRAWLALLRAAPAGLDAVLADDYALPNLDRSFLVGNSLVGDHDPTRLADVLDAEGEELVARIGACRRAYATARGDRRESLARDLDRLTDALDAKLEPDTEPEMADIAAQVPEESFRWSRRFPDVVLDGGFDVVLGNPPYEGRSKQGYVRELSSLYADRHDFYETIPGMRPDLYQQFVVRGWELAREGGVLSFVTSDTFLTIRSKRATRNLLRRERLTDLVLADADFDASVDPAVFTLRTGDRPGWFNYLDARGNGSYDRFVRLGTDAPDGSGHSDGNGDGSRPGPADASERPDAVPVTDADGKRVGHRVRAALYRESLGGGFFRPTAANRRLHRAYLRRAGELAEEWDDALRDSRAFERRREAVERDHLGALEPGDVTLLGLLVTGGVGIQVPTNDESLAYLDGSEPAVEVAARNDDFRYVEPNEEGYYRMSRVITPAQVADPATLTPREREHGIAGDEHDAVWVPIEKGKRGAFYRPPVEYINWSRGAVRRYREHPRAYLRNSRHYFAEGVFAAGQGSGDPEFRYTNHRVVDHSGNILVPVTDRVPVAYLLGVLCSSLSAYLLGEFVNHSVNTQLSDVRRLPVRLPTDDERARVERLVERAIAVRTDERDGNVSTLRDRLDDAVADIYGVDRAVFEP